MRVGSSPSRLNGKTPAVKGKLPGKFSERNQRKISPLSSNLGSATLRMFVPDNVVKIRLVRNALSRILTTNSLPEYALTVSSQQANKALEVGVNWV